MTGTSSHQVHLQVVEPALNKSLHLLLVLFLSFVSQVNSRNPKLDLNWRCSERSALVQSSDGSLSLLHCLKKHKSVLESTGASGTFFGLQLDANYATNRRKNFADVFFSALSRDVVNEQVGLEELFHVLLDWSPALVRSHVIFSLGHMGANEQEVSVLNLLFVHFSDRVLGALSLLEANKSTVLHSVIAISMLHKSRSYHSKCREHLFQLLFVSASGEALYKNVVERFLGSLTLWVGSLLMKEYF